MTHRGEQEICDPFHLGDSCINRELYFLFTYPPKFCITTVCNFSWMLQLSQEKARTILLQNFGDKENVMDNKKMVNC